MKPITVGPNLIYFLFPIEAKYWAMKVIMHPAMRRTTSMAAE